MIGVALLDLSTGEFTTAEYHGADGLQALADEIATLRPREIVVAGATPTSPRQLPEIARLQLPVTNADGWSFEPEAARRALLDQLKTHGLEGFGLDGRDGRHPGRRRAASRTSATRRRPTSRTCAPSATRRPPTACSSIRSR